LLHFIAYYLYFREVKTPETRSISIFLRTWCPFPYELNNAWPAEK